ncbi:MAG: 50S ribosomal protein L13 [Firmicutes bacterium]|nr:50S ribosomal protein L13 [Bacillota bacterium]
MAKPAEIERKWYIIDAAGRPLGRTASEAARILRGKHKPIFTPHIDTGDFVIIINADQAILTGKKLDQKMYYHHSGYPGGLKEVKYKDLMAKKPVLAVEKAVKGMLPHNSLGRATAKKLKVYAGSEHPHAAQKPEILEF